MFWRFLLAVSIALVAAPAGAQIFFVGASNETNNGNAVTTVTLPRPAGTGAGDVVVAQLAIRGGTGASIGVAPPGWTLASRTDSGTTMAQLVYWRVATASEPASYSWSFTPSARANGTAASFRAVLASNPIDAVAGAGMTTNTNGFTAPAVTTTVANTMLVGMFSIDDGTTSFTPPPDMIERVDTATSAGPNGVTASLATALFAGPGNSGSRTATSLSPGRGVATLVSLRPDPNYAPPVGGFNAFDTSTAAGATTGVIRTKIAGASFSLAIVALDATRTSVLTNFSGEVTVELLDGSNNAGALDAASGCRSSWTTIQVASPNPAFASGDNGRISVGFTVANAWRDVRVRITFTQGATAVAGCSSDNFAIRPSAFASVQALDANDTTAGLTRPLNNVSATSGVVHRAGRAFSVLAQAVSATGAATGGYGGAPALAVAGCAQPAGCTAGTLTSALTGSGGAVTGSATYSEAGVITATLEDSGFAAVDAADSSLAERTIASGAVTIGRFVPDAYQLTVSTTPQFVAPLCAVGPARQAFSFVGQPFLFGTVPVVLATPRNAAGAALVNARPRFAAVHLTFPVSAAGAPVALTGATAVANIAHSATSLITFDAGSFTFTRGVAPVSSFVPTLSMTVNLADTTENAAAGNSTINALAALTISPIDFAAGAGTFHYGRAQLRSTYGDARRELYVPLEIQRYNGLGWVALPEAGSCLVAAPTTFAYSNATGLLTSGGGLPNCASRVASTVTTSNGRAAIRLDKPGGVTTTAASAMTMALNLLATPAGTSCSGATPTAATTVSAPWLANPDGSNPSARLTWGRSRGELLGLRERFD
jgi:hypothetical protein